MKWCVTIGFETVEVTADDCAGAIKAARLALGRTYPRLYDMIMGKEDEKFTAEILDA